MSAVVEQEQAVETIKLDIACGARKAPGWFGIDVAAVEGVDLVLDVTTFPWRQIKSNSVSEARCHHFVEHLPHREAPYVEVSGGVIEMLSTQRWARSVRDWGHVRDLWFDFWEEVHRVLVPGGTIEVATPYYSSRRADQDPTHERRICEESYLYLSQRWLAQNLCVYPYRADFEVVSSMRYVFDDSTTVTESDVRSHINAVADYGVVLRAIKPSVCWWKK